MIYQRVSFDWKRFCERYRIDFVTSGPNTAKGNISIHCVWCGNSDPSHHMGLSLDKSRPYFGCLRNQKHRGKNPAYLISHLLNISEKEAAAIVHAGTASVDDFDSMVDQLKNGKTKEADKASRFPSKFPDTFRRFGGKSVYEIEFRQYMAERGFPFHVLLRYRLMWALTGEQAFRIIFPIYDGMDLIGWTGRAIRHTTIRYKAFDAMGKDALMTFPGLHAAKVLVICEGPMDALKINCAGNSLGIAAVATMGTSVTNEQIRRINKLASAPNFEKAVLLFDHDAHLQAFDLVDELCITNQKIKLGNLPDGYKDPGELPLAVAKIFCRNLLTDV